MSLTCRKMIEWRGEKNYLPNNSECIIFKNVYGKLQAKNIPRFQLGRC